MQQTFFPGMEIPEQGGRPVYQADLNEAQLAAVTYLDGPLLVIAGAGSGKTRTLVYRVAYLVEQGIDPGGILLLTFTRKAAQEMLWRAGRLLDDTCKQVTGGTFHAVSNVLLRRYGRHLGYPPNFTILDRSDAEGIVNLLKSSLSLSGAGKRFPTKRVIINLFSKAINRSVSLEDLVYDEYAHLSEYLEDLLSLLDHYVNFKLEHALMDYDDLLVNWQRVMLEAPGVREEIAARYRHVLVDEYQDTNSIQGEIVRLLAAGHRNIMAVGDDSQSIYSFRGANFRNIMEFPRIFPETRIVKLEENYRSTQPILNLGNAIISRAGEKYTKSLFSSIEEGDKPVIYEARDSADEARYILDRISARRAAGVAYSDMAVLFRSGFHSYKLEIELGSRNMLFEKRGGLKLTESAHIKDILSFFRILVNPQDNLAWNRLLLLQDKIGPKTAQNILAGIKGAQDQVAALREAARGRQAEVLHGLADLFASLHEPGLLPLAQFERLREYYQPLFERVYHDDYPRRSKDFEQLQAIISSYADLQKFVDDTALEPPEEGEGADERSAGADRLVLSTIHSAKGLEWDTVFIMNLADGHFPHANTKPGEQWEEERRLLYVAATRAKRHLYCTYPRETFSADRTTQRTTLSSFLAEIPRENYVREGGHLSTVHSPASSDGIFAVKRAGPPRHKASAAMAAPDILKEGMVVRHPFFGQGKVEKLVGTRSADVVFSGHGRKRLHLDYAKLKIVD